MFKQNKLKSMADIEKERKMKKNKTTTPEAATVKSSKTVHIVYIAILVTIAVAIASFVSGMNYQKQINDDKAAAVSTALKADTPQKTVNRLSYSEAQPTPTVAPQPIAAVVGLNPRKATPELCATYDPLLTRYDWNIKIAQALMRVESGCNPVRDNSGLNSDGTNDVGLMQINSIHIPTLITDEARRDPEANIRAAYAIYLGSLKRSGDGWKAWSAYNNGAYLTAIR